MTAHCSCRESKGLTPEERAEVARRNGAKSRGPVTPEGKRRVGRNGFRSGTLARTVVLERESARRFTWLLSKLRRQLQPEDLIEADLIEKIAVTRWRQMRGWSLERAGIAREIRHNPVAFADEGPEIPVITARRNPVFESIARDESRLDRQYDRALRTFLHHRKTRLQTQSKAAKSIT